MPDYKNSLIYKIYCKNDYITDFYIGSTTNLYSRKTSHKSDCNNKKRKHYNRKVYKFIRENGGFENWDFIILENYKCKNKKELNKKEAEYIKKLKPTLNKELPGRTNNEWKKDNIYRWKEYNEKSNNRRLKPIECDICGKMTSLSHLARHKKTIYCKSFIK